jgi:hypothetical protein
LVAVKVAPATLRLIPVEMAALVVVVVVTLVQALVALQHLVKDTMVV